MATKIKIENNKLVELSRLLGDTFRQSFFAQKKLCLVLDLDHTLLHSMNFKDVSKEEQEVLNLRVSSKKDIDGNGLYKNNDLRMYTKLRPYTREFLKEASGMFELFIYTMGSRYYAQEMGRLLDPDGVLFYGNIVSRDDSTIEDMKNLDILIGPNEKNSIIIDDRIDVWENNKKNLMWIDEYNYFTEECRGHKLKMDDEEGYGDEDTALKSISEVLKDVHKKFFEINPVPQNPVELPEYVKSVDVRPVLKVYRKKFWEDELLKLLQSNLHVR